MERCKAICAGLAKKGFASTNVVFGIGSYTYQMVTRDTFGFAMKATYGVINGKPTEIFKDPKTDSGIKKSARGLLRVNDDLTLSERVTPEEEKTGMLQTVFLDGKLVNEQTLFQIRNVCFMRRLNNIGTPYFTVENRIFHKKELEKDIIKKFGGGWTVNPQHVDFSAVDYIWYHTEKDVYRISVADVNKYGIEREFKGEVKYVVPLKYWDYALKSKPQEKGRFF
jgi:hypothetical protein